MSVFGCVSLTTQEDKFAKYSYNTLAAAGETYDALMKSAARLYKEGKINDEQKAEILDIATTYWVAYQTATDSLIAYYQLKEEMLINPDIKETELEKYLSLLTTAMNEVETIITNLAIYVGKFM
jgi:hypothetical protein